MIKIRVVLKTIWEIVVALFLLVILSILQLLLVPAIVACVALILWIAVIITIVYRYSVRLLKYSRRVSIIYEGWQFGSLHNGYAHYGLLYIATGGDGFVAQVAGFVFVVKISKK